MSRYLIINADDFGLTSGVNRGIIEGFRSGIVTSTTIMVNMPGFKNAVALAKENPDLPVGLHLNLTYGRPVLNQDQVASLTDKKGSFVGDPNFVLQQGRKKEVELEYRAQINKFQDSGLTLSHIDTHHHLHRNERVLDIVLGLASELGVPVRCLNKKAFTRRGVDRIARFIEFEDYEGGFGKLIDFLYTLPEGPTETLCHLGYVDNELKELSVYNVEREQELTIWLNPKIRLFIKKYGIILTNYRELRKNPE